MREQRIEQWALGRAGTAEDSAAGFDDRPGGRTTGALNDVSAGVSSYPSQTRISRRVPRPTNQPRQLAQFKLLGWGEKQSDGSSLLV